MMDEYASGFVETRAEKVWWDAIIEDYSMNFVDTHAKKVYGMMS